MKPGGVLTASQQTKFSTFHARGPRSWAPREATLPIHQGQHDSAKPPSTGLVSVPSKHCTSASLKKITKRSFLSTKD